MAESNLAGSIKLCKQYVASYNSFSVVLVFSILSLGSILISDLVVANLLMYSLPGMILLYLAAPFLHQRCFSMRSRLTVVSREAKKKQHVYTHIF